jgi:aryl-alcohol dehydrogenase-like predicted oxidoreductase
MEQIEFVKTGLMTSRIGLGTWAMGGWMWGGTDEAQSIATIRSAIDRGVTLIDTAPVYGFAAPRRSSARRWKVRCATR